MSSLANFQLDGISPQIYGLHSSLTYVWDVATLTWIKNTGAGGGGGGAATIADGADVAEGATADAALVTDASGTVSSKLRGLVKWAFERMPSALGQSTMAASFPVTLASNQSALAVTTGGLTDAQLRASAVPVSGPLTDTQLRATPVPVSGTVTATGPLTDAQLRATPVPVSGTVTASGPLTDTQLRAAPVPVSGTVAVTNAGLTNLDVALSTRLKPADTLAAVTSITNVVHVDDNAGSLTIDAPVGTPAFIRLSDGSAVLIGQKAMASSLPVVLASDQTAIPVNGDVDHDAVNTLKNVQVSGNASPSDVPPAVVSAPGDRSRIWTDRSGAQIGRTRRLRESYTVVFRLAEAAARLDQTFTQVANTTKQWATLHHTAGATKEVKLSKAMAYITADTTVGIQGVIELRQISAAPATGNPAIVPTPHRRGGTAAEAVALYLPTTAGTEANVNSPIGHVPFDTGIAGAVSTVNPVPILTPIVLYDSAQEDPEVLPPTLPVGTLDGWAITVRTVGAPVLRITAVMRFTEEIP